MEDWNFPCLGGAYPASLFCKHLFKHIADSGEGYLRGGKVFQLATNGGGQVILEPVNPASAVTWLERFIFCYTADNKGNKRKVGLTEKQTRIVLAAAERLQLPPIETIVNAPVLRENNGEVVYAQKGYCRELRLYVCGETDLPPVESKKEAVDNINRILVDYRFATEKDRSRAVASLLTPGFKQGNFIKGHVPLDLFEADETQSGKTKLAECKPAIYGEDPQFVAKRNAGVGSVDESISQTIIRGLPFILLDNYRGELKSEFLECLLTGGRRLKARGLRVSIEVDPSRFFFSISSNGMDTTPDLCERVNLIRIAKRRDYKFPQFREGSLPTSTYWRTGRSTSPQSTVSSGAGVRMDGTRTRLPSTVSLNGRGSWIGSSRTTSGCRRCWTGTGRRSSTLNTPRSPF